MGSIYLFPIFIPCIYVYAVKGVYQKYNRFFVYEKNNAVKSQKHIYFLQLIKQLFGQSQFDLLQFEQAEPFL